MTVTAENRVGKPRGIGGNERDLAPDAVLYHIAAGVLDTQERAGQVGVYHLAEFLGGQIVDMGVAPYGGAVDVKIHRSEGLPGGFHQLFNVGFFPNVGPAENHSVRAEARFFQNRQRVVALGLAGAGDDHPGPALEQTKRNVEAQAGGGAGHHGYLVPDGEHVLHGTGFLHIALQHGFVGGIHVKIHRLTLPFR